MRGKKNKEKNDKNNIFYIYFNQCKNWLLTQCISKQYFQFVEAWLAKMQFGIDYKILQQQFFFKISWSVISNIMFYLTFKKYLILSFGFKWGGGGRWYLNINMQQILLCIWSISNAYGTMDSLKNWKKKPEESINLSAKFEGVHFKLFLFFFYFLYCTPTKLYFMITS